MFRAPGPPTLYGFVLDGAKCVIVTYDAAKHVDDEEEEEGNDDQRPEGRDRLASPGTIASDGGEEHFGASIIEGTPGRSGDATEGPKVMEKRKQKEKEKEKKKQKRKAVMRSMALCNFFQDGQDVWNAFSIAVTVCCARDEMVKRLKIETEEDGRGRKRKRSAEDMTRAGVGATIGNGGRVITAKRRRMDFATDEDL
jgi:hypothetical protein